MIISICGSSGSGKTTLVKNLIALAETVTPIQQEGRKQPIGYELTLSGRLRPLRLMGHYEAASGGCDTIKDTPWVFEELLRLNADGADVIYEGLFVMNMTKGPEVARKTGAVSVLHLQTTVEECLEAIHKRRETSGRQHARPVSRDVTESNAKRARNYASNMKWAGAQVYPVKREEALPKLLEILGVKLEGAAT